MAIKRAKKKDLRFIQKIQQQAFAALYTNYQDHETSPATVSLERLEEKWARPSVHFYLLFVEATCIGSVKVEESEGVVRISNLAVLPTYQGQGYGRQAMFEIEANYPFARSFTLDTIAEEPQLVAFYQGLGYQLTGKRHVLQAGMTSIGFRKDC